VFIKKSKTLHIQEYELPIVIQKDREGGFTAECLVWQDCYAQGETIEETVNEISCVASSLMELYREEGMKIPLKLKKEIQFRAATRGLTLFSSLLPRYSAW